MGWSELNASAGAKPVQTTAPSGAQAGGWAAANAGVTGRAKQSTQPTQQQQVELQIKQNQPAIPSVAAANQQPFLEGAKISAPAQKKFAIKGIRFNNPFNNKTGMPNLEIDNPRIETREDSSFIQKGIAAAGNVFGSSFTGIVNSLGELFDVSLATPYDKGQKAAYEEKISQGQPTLNPAIDSRIKAGKAAFPTTAEKVGAGVNVGTAALNADFSLVAAQLEAAKELPVVGKGLRLDSVVPGFKKLEARYPVLEGAGLNFTTVGIGFDLLDKASRFAGSRVVDILPVSDESKEVLRRPIEDLAGIVGTLAGVKAVHIASKSGGGRAVDALPISETNKGRIKTGVSTAASFGMEPFSATYKGILGSVRGKVESRQAKGEDITPEVAKMIVSEAVKENPAPDLPARMTVVTPDGKVQVNTNQKLVLENLIKGREGLDYKVVDDLGNDPVTGEKMTSRFDWDYASQKGTITATDKTTAVNLAHELGHFVDRKLGYALSKTLSDVLPDYRGQRDQINQMLADYALDRLGGTATKAEIDAEVLKIAENINSEVKVIASREARQTPAKQFAGAFGDVINDPSVRRNAPELAQLVDYSLGDVARKGATPDVRGTAGSVEEKASVMDALEGEKRGKLRDTVKNDEKFQGQEVAREMKKAAIEERGAMGSANFAWGDAAKAIRASKEFKKEGSVSDRTIQGTIMQKGDKTMLVPLGDVRAMAAKGWTVKFSMDEIAHANGFESAEDYYTFVTELDADSRAISRSSVQKEAHEYLMKNDPEYAKLDQAIDSLRNELVSEEAVIRADEQASAGEARRVSEEQAETTSVTEALEPTSAIEADNTKQSRVFDRMKAETPEELAGDAGYSVMNMAKDVEKAVKLVESDKQKAYRVAMGLEKIAEQTSTAVNIALADAALNAGNVELYAQLTKARSLAQTRRGQEIVAEKGSVTDNSTARYVKALIGDRMAQLGKSYLGDTRQMVKAETGMGSSAEKLGMEKIDAEVKDAQAKVREKRSKRFDIEAAQKLIDSLACA